jgi:hypothetical protein
MDKTLSCAECGADAERTGPTQKYCRPCSAERERLRQNAWAKAHPPKKGAIKRNYARRLALAKAVSGHYAGERRENAAWSPTALVDAKWRVVVAIPYVQSLSKNSIYAVGRGGHVYLREQAKAAKAVVEAKLRSALRGVRVATNRVWVDIFIQKPSHKSDAVNLVDMVCDAAKRAVGVDDRWFSILRLDWQVTRNNPQIFIGISQEEVPDAQVCSLCGHIKPLAEFSKNRSRKNGVSRECFVCRSRIRAAGAGVVVDEDGQMALLESIGARRRDDKERPRAEVRVWGLGEGR